MSEGHPTNDQPIRTQAALESPWVFVDIDTQRDFLEPAGALYIPGSEAIVENLFRLTKHARERGIPVLATACAHVPADPELQRFPPHCMIGSPGARRIEATAWQGGRVLGLQETVSGPRPLHLTVQKREYDVFSRADANQIVDLYNRDRPSFVVYGVATDYCVKAAAHGLLTRGCRVVLVVDAIRAINLESESQVLTMLVGEGALLTLTEVVCGAVLPSPA